MPADLANPISAHATGANKVRLLSDVERYRHLAPRLKSFRGSDPKDVIDRAMMCGWEIQARVGARLAEKGLGERNVLAERRLRDRGHDIRATATISVPEGGGRLTPTPLATAAIENRDRAGVSRQLATVQPMSAATLSIPKVTGGHTVYAPGEGTTITPSDAAFAMVNLSARSRFTLSYISQELEGDSLISFTDVAVRDMALAHAAREDDLFINGNGTSSYDHEVGLLPALGSAGVYTAPTATDTYQELVIGDWCGCMAELPHQFRHAGNAWLMSAEVYALGALRSVGGNAQGVDENGRPMFLGSPVYFSPRMPTTAAASQVCALFGDFSAAVTIGERLAFEIDISEHFRFSEEILALKATTRFDVNCHQVGDATNAGAVVGLKLGAGS